MRGSGDRGIPYVGRLSPPTAACGLSARAAEFSDIELLDAAFRPITPGPTPLSVMAAMLKKFRR